MDCDNSSDEMESAVRTLPNNIEIHICFSEMKKKKYKEQKTKEIISSFCALFNSHGGKVTMEFVAATESDVHSFKRAIEQQLSHIVGFSSMRDHIDLLSSRTDGCVFIVKGVSSLCTMNYNLYVPSETQVVAVPPKTPIVHIGEILSSEKCIVEVGELVEIGMHCKEFVLQQNIAELIESKKVQFKQVKAEKSKCVTLGDRMTNKANKFANYVSAFANHLGGHIYYGLEDDGVVKGELVEDKDEIIKKVSKAINKMVWPTECEGPKRGQHWEIFFEPVNDVNGDVVPSTFVIVVYIAHCTGGVFTEEPESYHVVDGEVRRIGLLEWRELMFQTTLPQHVKRLQWSSERKEKRFYSLLDKMAYLRNNGKREDFEHFAEKKIKIESNNEVNLTILSQRSIFASRRNELKKAEKLIKEYDELLHRNGNNGDFMIFMCLGVYLRSTMERSATNHKESFDLATSGLQIVELIPPGLCSASFYCHTASLLTTLACEKNCEDRCGKIALAKTFYGKAIEHVSHVRSGFTKTVVDVQQKIYIDIAFLCLACSMNGTMVVTAVIPEDDITCAKNCLMKIEELILEGHALSFYRQIQHLLVQSSLFFRQSQLSTLTHQPHRPQLESSLQYSKKALNLARQCHLREMVFCCRRQIACVTEEIIRDCFRNLKLKKMQGLVEEQ